MLRNRDSKIDIHIWDEIALNWTFASRPYVKEISVVRHLPNELKTLQSLLITHYIVIKTINNVSHIKSPTYNDKLEYIDYLTILSARLLQFMDNDKIDSIVENEIEQIIQIFRKHMVLIKNKEVRNAWLDLVRYLPARSVNEIKAILQLVEETTDEQLLKVYAEVIINSEPNSAEAWKILESGDGTEVASVKMPSRILCKGKIGKERLQS